MKKTTTTFAAIAFFTLATLPAFSSDEMSEPETYIHSVRYFCAYSALTGGISTSDENAEKAKLAIKEALTKICYEEDEHVMSFFFSVYPLLAGVTDGLETADIVWSMVKIAPAKRVDLFDAVQPLFQSVTDGSSRPEILSSVAPISNEKRPFAIDFVSSLVPKMTSTEGIGPLIRHATEIPENNRQAHIEFLTPFFQDISLPSQYSEVLLAQRSIMKDSIEGDLENGTLEAAAPFFEGVSAGNDRAVVTQTVFQIPAQNREAVLTASLPFLEGVTRGVDRGLIIHAISKILDSRRDSVLEFVMPFFKEAPHPTYGALTIEVADEIYSSDLTPDRFREIMEHALDRNPTYHEPMDFYNYFL
ncbi:MAG: hypothetical protein LCH26_02990 [Proteobacteria bacterium]|nr:hypothetical protein [Pseudomonadota bacterium]